MIRSILALLVIATAVSAIPASVSAIADSISMGAGYANQVWYQPGQQTTSSPQASWHLGFQGGMSATIIVNDGLSNFKVFLVPNSTPATYDNLDTTGMSSWERLYNKPATWTGALNTPAEPGSLFDYGWGMYNMQVHELQGSRVFVVVTPDGTAWKLFIQSWSGFSYKFKYAHIDGTDEHIAEVPTNGFVEKVFTYWSLADHAMLDREPPAASWDLTFLKYTDLVRLGPGDPVPYPVVGILARPSIKLAKVMGADPSLLAPPALSEFDTTANLVGWDWKTYDQGTNSYTIADSTAFFVLRTDGSMWRMILTGFGGTTTGTIAFDAEAVVTSVADHNMPNENVLGVHPNVVQASDAVNVAFNTSTRIVAVSIVDLTGNTVRSVASNLDAGMYAVPVSTAGLAAGHYRVVVSTPAHTITSALIIQ